MPETLDATYEQSLRRVDKQKWDYTYRLFQCLIVSKRPLLVEELAELFAIRLNVDEIPRFNASWRPENPEETILSACSTLVAVVNNHGRKIVQFSHFSVGEYLTSDRIAISEHVSHFHILPRPAHTLLARACLSVLLQLDDRVVRDEDQTDRFPLVSYAARYWVDHAQFDDVTSEIQHGMECLFDRDKPHFTMWLTLCDIDTRPGDGATFDLFAPYSKSPASPLYYAALCGFQDLVEHLMDSRPQDVNLDGGYYVRPLVAALAGEHFQTARLLCERGADPNVRGVYGRNPLHAAAFSGNFNEVRILIEYGPTNIDVRDRVGWTPLLWVSKSPNFKDGSVLRSLLDYGADINLPNQIGWTPLHLASFNGALVVVRLLLEYRADILAKDNRGKTALQVAAWRRHDKIVKLLREYGAK